MFSNSYHSAGEIIKQLVEKYKLEAAFQESKIPDVWLHVVGETASKYAFVLRYDQGTVVVAVANSVWLTELSMRKEELIERMNQELGRAVVGNIFFVDHRDKKNYHRNR